MTRMVVKDERGFILAVLYPDGSGRYRIVRQPPCSLGVFFQILTYLMDEHIPVK